jgi:hypothetical protein
MPRGNPNWTKKKTEIIDSSLPIDVQKLIQEALEKQRKEFEAENNDEILMIPDETQVEIRSNVCGKFILREDRGKANIFKPFAKYRDTARLSYEDLCLVYGAKPEFFRKGKLAIIKVFSDNKKITLEHIYKDMGLEEIYLNKDRVNPVTIEEIFSDKVSEREFEKLITNSSDMSELILEVAIQLYRTARFNNSTKQAFLKQVFGNPNLFR